MENSSICLDSQVLNLCPDRSVHTSNLMDMNAEMLVTVPKDTSIVPTHSDAALRSVEILKKVWGDTPSADQDQIDKEDDGKTDKSFTPFVSNRQKKNKLQLSKGLKDDCIP